MAKVEKTIIVRAPVEQVFDYLDEPTHHPEIWPSLVEVSDVQQLPNGGNQCHYVYKMAGMRFEGTSQDIEYVANARIVTKNTDGIESTMTWTFEPVDDGTKVILEIEYTVPFPLLGKLTEAVIAKMNEREIALLLANLKAQMEA